MGQGLTHPYSKAGGQVMKRRGFSLVEILVVLGVIGVLMAMAIPVIRNSRSTSQANECTHNRLMVDAAKDRYAMELRKPRGFTPDWDDIMPFAHRGTTASCPSGGEYTLGPIGTPCACDIHD